MNQQEAYKRSAEIINRFTEIKKLIQEIKEETGAYPNNYYYNYVDNYSIDPILKPHGFKAVPVGWSESTAECKGSDIYGPGK